MAGLIQEINGYAIYATQSLSSSYADTASVLLGSIQSASYALTASYALSGVGGGGTPGGSNTQIQYNNGGAFGGVSTLTFDGTTLRATGSFTGSLTGNLTGTASRATTAGTASYSTTLGATLRTGVGGAIALANSDGTVISTLSPFTSSFALTASSVSTLNQTVTINGNLNVFGTASFTFLTASQLNISSSYISVNVFEPQQRFGGLYVFDSGSSAATASLSWDSLNNHWLYTNATGSTYTGGMLISGPRNTGSIGNEVGTTFNALMKGQGGDHITSSGIFDDGANIYGVRDLKLTGSIFVSASAQTMGQFVGNNNGYVEFSIRNTNTGLSASGDIAIYADTGTVLNNYIDMGINNSGLTGSYFYGGTDFGNALDAYVYNVGGNLRIGNATSQAPFSQSFYLFSNPHATPDIAITGSKVGFGTITPNFTLDVSGSANITGSLLLPGLTTTNQNNVVTVDTATGQLYYTASSAFGGGGTVVTGTDYGIVYAASLGYFMP